MSLMELFGGTQASARADDGDQVVAFGALAAAGAAGRDRAGDLVAIDFAEGRGLGEFARLAIGIGGRRAAFGAGRQTPVDAVAVGVIGDDEYAPFRLRGIDQAKAESSAETDQDCAHETVRFVGGAYLGTDNDNASEIVKTRLTAVAAVVSGEKTRNIPRVMQLARGVDGGGAKPQCAYHDRPDPYLRH